MTDDMFNIFMGDKSLEDVEVPRFITGWKGFDEAVSGPDRYGLALRSLIHTYGRSRSGKTTFDWSLTTKICAELEKNLVMANFENIDRRFFINVAKAQGFGPPLQVKEIQYQYPKVDCGLAMKQLTKDVTSDDFFCGILDSVGAVMGASEAENDETYGERNIGGRAHIMNQFTRELTTYFGSSSNNNGVVCVTNHVQPKIGFVGWNIPGGTGLQFFSHYDLYLKRGTEYGPNYVINGEVKKSKYGSAGGKFGVFVLYGKGVHSGMTALMDCQERKLLIAGAKTTSKMKVKETGEELNSFKNYVELAHEGATEEFQIFHDLLGDNDA